MKSILVAFLLLCSSAFAAGPSPQQISFKSGADTINGTLYTPTGAGKRAPAIVVIHEWWGLNDWVKEQAAKFSGQGYVTLAVDLYRGKVTSNPDEAHELMRGLAPERAVQDMKAAVAYL